MKFSGLVLFLLSTLTPVFAVAEYWISVASFKNRDSAESALVGAQKRADQKFLVRGASTSMGYFFRVLSGPYATRELAMDAQQSIAYAGLNAGWIWQSESTVSMATNTPAPPRGDRSSAEADPIFDERRYSRDWDADFRYDGERDLGPTDPLMPEGVRPSQEALPDIPDRAPSGYQLNKLRREARAPPSLSSPFFVSMIQISPKFPLSAATIPPQTTRPATLQASDAPTVSFSLDAPIALVRRDEIPPDFAVDGQLDEEIWGLLPGADDFLVGDPDTLEKPAYSTLVKAFYTSKGLYVAIDMEQPRNTLVRRLSSRDSRRTKRDDVSLSLDTSGEGRYGYWLNVALGGSQSDGTLLPERQYSSDWDGAWYSGTAITDSGWSAEFYLPWSQVAMPKTGVKRTIKVYVSRKVAHLDERWSLPALPYTQPLFMSVMQPLTLQQVAPVQQWSVFPYLSSTFDWINSKFEHNVGGDAFWRPSTNFQATAALKPDFGSVESDDVVVNLGAFETFFPEKRLFFQEGIEVFTATQRAEGGNPVTLLNTRRIGGVGRIPEVPDGVTLADIELQKPVALAGALKTVGAVGAFRYGLLGAVEEKTVYESQGQQFKQSGTDYGVARVLYEGKSLAGDYRALGFLSSLTRHSEQDTQAHGVDYHYLTKQGDWKVDGQFLFSNADQRQDGFGGFADIRRDFGGGRRMQLGYSHYDKYLNINDLGYLRRNDLRGANGRYEISRSDSPKYRKMYVASWFRLERNSAGEYVRKAIGFDAEVDFLGRDELRIGAAFFPSRDEDFDSRGNGSYRLGDRDRLTLRYRSDRAKPLSYEINLHRENESLGGVQVTTAFNLNWRPYDNIGASLRIGYKDRAGWLLWQDGIDFATYNAHEWRPEVRLEYFPNAKHQFKLSGQWVGIRAKRVQNYQLRISGGSLVPVDDSVTRSDDFAISNLSLQLRYRWEIAPLSDLFVVYTANGRQEVIREAFDELFSSALSDPVAEQFAVKLRYRFGS